MTGIGLLSSPAGEMIARFVLGGAIVSFFAAIAFFISPAAASWILMRYKTRALATTAGLLPVWLGTSLILWFLASR